MSREDILLSMFDVAGLGLEVGPAYSPLLPKSRHENVETLDYSTKQALLEKYAKAERIELGNIEEPTYVSDGRPMSEAIGDTARYDYIIASHVIEHTVDLVGFLQDCERLLKPEGRLVLAVPDKRFCFDFLRTTTSTAQVLAARREERKIPSAETYFDSFANSCLRGDAPGWCDAYDRASIRFTYPETKSISDYKAPITSTEYRDEHSWVFTPSSFRLILHDLYKLNLIGLKEAVFKDTIGTEFFLAYSRNASGSDLARLDLAKGAVEELAAPFVDALREKLNASEAARHDTEDHLSKLSSELEEAKGSIAALEKERDEVLASPAWKWGQKIEHLGRRVGLFRDP